MPCNPHRLPLIIKIGLLAAQANVHTTLYEKFPITMDPLDTDPYDYLDEELWYSVDELVNELAEMDHQNDFYPDASPLLTEFGLLRDYWAARGRLDPEEYRLS
ncbi:hypothetical protein [Pseudomonas sp. MWU13-2105]|uniref:hypothetical protein n=1 Tax=Pseudomonas sp. MWU13-2105 TaxID=2935074 RepID=UPI00200ECCA3|nr:hypothetical protein [Pseudomonas sp. MWU13-2105]